MTAIIEFITGIADGLFAIVDFMGGLIEDLLYVVTLVGKFVVSIPEYLSWLPAPVLALFVSLFSVVVIYKIVGREG